MADERVRESRIRVAPARFADMVPTDDVPMSSDSELESRRRASTSRLQVAPPAPENLLRQATTKILRQNGKHCH